ncbi:MAG: UDP-2,3-diacylglucosamine diphosphatase [Rhodoferax sp.]|nr:UDP-2,3-diacylglucosamine diphosphatase [Rhodoferax sp.]
MKAPAAWRCVDFISDLHLQASQPDTFLAWQHYLTSTPADAVFILGDLFEVWVGDDAAAPHANAQTETSPDSCADGALSFEARCQHTLTQASQRLALYFMHGNRDFLLGSAFARACGMTLLADPCMLVFDAQRWLLSHGDALCLDDTEYQQFRTLVRSADWQQAFLAKPLAQRQTIARALRAQSQARKASGAAYADIDRSAALEWLEHAGAATLIHGHTHQPADHLLHSASGSTHQRRVLSDWDASARPPRLQVLRLQRDQAPQRVELSGFK